MLNENNIEAPKVCWSKEECTKQNLKIENKQKTIISLLSNMTLSSYV